MWLIPVVVLAGFVAWNAGGEATSAPSPAATLVRPTNAWIDVLREIDQGRAQAFINDDPVGLLRIEVIHSAAHESDLRIMADLRNRKVTPDRQPLRVVAVEEVFLRRAGTEEVVRLRVTDTMSEYQLVDAAGTVVERRPARGLRTWFIDLERSGHARWKLQRVSPATASQSSARATDRGM